MSRSAGAPTIYLAGPEVFFPNALEIGDQKKKICTSYGFDAHFPLDRLPDVGRDPLDVAKQIFSICLEMMDDSDLVVANMTPFRGVSMDVGTAIELGYMYAQGKPVFGYTNDVQDYAARVTTAGVMVSDQQVEDFGLSDNLMCEGVVRWPRNSPPKGSDGGVIRTEVLDDERFLSLDGFEAAVQQARDYLDNAPSSPR